MSACTVTRVLYKRLLNQAKFHDQCPALKALLSHQGNTSLANTTNRYESDKEAGSEVVERATKALMQGGTYYKPSQSLVRLVQESFRAQESVSIDAGFLASRCLDANEQLATSIIPRDVLFPELSECKEPPAPAAWWPDAALKLSKRLQGSALRDKLAQGTLLVAHPLLLQSTLTRSLVLVCEHDGQGDVGLVVNRPTTVTLRDGLEKREEGYSSQLQEVLEVFGDNVLWRGGDVSEKLGVLHPHGHLSRAKQAARMVLQGKAEASDFKLFRGYCGWGSGQLDGEMDQNIWFSTDGPAVTSFALAGADSGKTGAVNVDELNEEVAKGTSVDDSDGLLHAERHWGGALSALGGEYAAMAGIPEEQLRWSDNLWSRNAAGLLADQILGEVDAMEEE